MTKGDNIRLLSDCSRFYTKKSTITIQSSVVFRYYRVAILNGNMTKMKRSNLTTTHTADKAGGVVVMGGKS